jgi:hypothetical protein
MQVKQTLKTGVEDGIISPEEVLILNPLKVLQPNDDPASPNQGIVAPNEVLNPY